LPQANFKEWFHGKASPIRRAFPWLPADLSDMNSFLKHEDGVVAIEYALVAGFIAGAIVFATVSIGATLSSIFTNLLFGFGS
jgi:Flp pilus assembly pilin Flp